MTRPVAALSSELLVRKGMARPLGLEPTERTPYDVVRTVRPSLAQPRASAPEVPVVAQTSPIIAPRAAVARAAVAWSALASRWGLPTILFIAGLGILVTVAITGPTSGPATAIATARIPPPMGRPFGPTPVSWVDDGLMANPALTGR